MVVRTDRDQVDVLLARRIGDRASGHTPDETRLRELPVDSARSRERLDLGVSHVFEDGRGGPSRVEGCCEVEDADEHELAVGLGESPRLSNRFDRFGRLVDAAKNSVEHGSSRLLLEAMLAAGSGRGIVEGSDPVAAKPRASPGLQALRLARVGDPDAGVDRDAAGGQADHRVQVELCDLREVRSQA